MGNLCSGRSDHSPHVELPKGERSSPNKKTNAPTVTYSEKPAETQGNSKIMRMETDEVPIPLAYNGSGKLEVTNLEGAK